MKRFILIPLIFSMLVGINISAHAEDTDQRLVVVNGNTGHVIYDDGHDDLFCVTRNRVVGYDDWGYPIKRRSVRCR